MAVPHFSVSIVARGRGGSAVMSAAYRHCARMEYDREARTIDYTRKQGLLHEEFVIPVDAPEWLRAMIADRSISGASEAFWNKVEGFEKRADAQLAKDVTIALPVELSPAQNIELVREFVAAHITPKGMVADWVFHDAPDNPHVHLMMTVRPLTEHGFGPKKVAMAGPDGKPIRNDAGKIVYDLWAGNSEHFNLFRDGWFACQNRHLARAGLDIRIDGRSFEKQGIELAPTIHLGVGAKAIERKSDLSGDAASLERVGMQDARREQNARRITSSPDLVIDMIMRERSVFDSHDVAKILYRYTADAVLFQNLMARILQSPQILRLDVERIDFATGQRLPAKYTSRAMIRLEAAMTNRAVWLSNRSSHRVEARVLGATFARHDTLSDEQKTAIQHIVASPRVSAVIGRAGAGKTTMMKAAREVWENSGYRVVGGALAGKAAEGLAHEAGISSRTLSSWELRWNRHRDLLDDKTIFVLDEAGMVSSRQMAFFVDMVVRTGAKLVLIGDPEQLQPIEAGAAFRTIADRIGYAELDTIYRQHDPWMRDASMDLARGDIGKAIETYRTNGRIIGADLKAQAVEHLIDDWSRDYDLTKTSLILAHLRRDVRLLNMAAREKLVEGGIIKNGSPFMTADGKRMFSAGDQIMFLRNEASLGVKNGTLAKVVEAGPGRIVAEFGEGVRRHRISVEQRFYNSVDHGYAATVHKSQGATVDTVKVLASLSLDRHLTYVAMTRHREDLRVYYGRRSIDKAGGLVKVLSRRNAKETTLDYAGGRLYAQSLRFAQARGLHIANIARTLLRDRLEWTLRQRSKFAELTGRLAALGKRLGLMENAPAPRSMEKKPLVSATTTFPQSIDDVVDSKLNADPALAQQWNEVSTRFYSVFANPADAFKTVDIDRMLTDDVTAKSTIARIVCEPERFGALKGKAGLLATPRDKADRQRALSNVQPLADSISDFLRQRGDAERQYRLEELTARQRHELEIPALSTSTNSVLERVRDAIDRNDLPAGLGYALADKLAKAELDEFAKAVSRRFGDRTFLAIGARDVTGDVFRQISAGMSDTQQAELRQAWPAMRTVQQMVAHVRSDEALKASEAMRVTQSKGLSLK
ncbi:Ti-type conjugative transfer relaxase TraA [Neorhizobium sp. NCHU2750]|uniref:Ti-type conjugative transfer relaxase TraA n=1 Tax=Neorhizobium sp. NCHU2750 TaxID=1825976 RepID=UPI000E7678C9|nr:conjugal transfer protein [Neorhizobium sp. NCHU2750]